MNTVSDRVELAATTVDEDAFTRAADGTLIPQTSSRAIITTMLRQLNVTPGSRILEIGTGSGYSTALLAELAGPHGHVTTLDVVPQLTSRAGPLLTAQGYPNTRALTGDGAKGAPEHGPYDRIIAWTTPETIPQAWTAQASHCAVLVAPVNLTGLSKTYAVLTAKLDHGTPTAQQHLTRGAFVEMSDQIATQWLTPPHGIDALHLDADAQPWWLSAHWLRENDSRTVGTALAQRLSRERRACGELLGEHDDAVGFYAWLLATRPDGLTTACLGEPSWQIGHTSATSAALIPLAQPGPLSTVGDTSSTKALTAWVKAWHTAGSPAWNALRPELSKATDGNWIVRATTAHR